MLAGSDDSTALAFEGLQASHLPLPWASQAAPALSHADLGVGQCRESLPSNLETTLLSNVHATETLDYQQAAYHSQVSY